MARLVLGSRGSALALAQVRLVEEALRHTHPGIEIEVKIITTAGDRGQNAAAAPVGEAGLKGLFTKEIQEALLDGSIDAAVHSLKDLPGATPPTLGLAAVLPRADPADLLISARYAGLAALPPGARVGTGSVRRSRQLQWLRPGLSIIELRGNVPTRLEKLSALGLDAIVLARAGLERLGYSVPPGQLECDAGSFYASTLDTLPAIGQGAIGIETRRDDHAINAILASIDHHPTHTCIRAERELLRLLGGDCRLPVAARATLNASGILQANALLFTDRAIEPAQAYASGPASAPEEVGNQLFAEIKRAINK